MISVSKLLCDLDDDQEQNGEVCDIIEAESTQFRPVVVWNVTSASNLDYEYSVTHTTPGRDEAELTTAEASAVIQDLADYGVSTLEFGGGEPLLRDDLEELIEYATEAGIRTVLLTNGTLLTEERARSLEDAGLSFVSVAIDGLPDHHDEICGREGAFDDALSGIRAAQDVGLATGVRFTLTKHNAGDMEELVDLLALRDVTCFWFYHMEYSEGNREIMELDIDQDARRQAVRRVCDITMDAHERGHDIETLLAGNYSDTGYIYQYARDELDDRQVKKIREYLEETGGDPAGERIADIDYQGNVHLTQFWQEYSLGNVRDRPFSAIWEDESNPLLGKMRDREEHLPDRCPDCEYYAMCRGGSRHRALASTGDLWAPDPQCYLTDEELSLDTPPTE